jgi:hypothetical protein
MDYIFADHNRSWVKYIILNRVYKKQIGASLVNNLFNENMIISKV